MFSRVSGTLGIADLKSATRRDPARAYRALGTFGAPLTGLEERDLATSARSSRSAFLPSASTSSRESTAWRSARLRKRRCLRLPTLHIPCDEVHELLGVCQAVGVLLSPLRRAALLVGGSAVLVLLLRLLALFVLELLVVDVLVLPRLLGAGLGARLPEPKPAQDRRRRKELNLGLGVLSSVLEKPSVRRRDVEQLLATRNHRLRRSALSHPGRLGFETSSTAIPIARWATPRRPFTARPQAAIRRSGAAGRSGRAARTVPAAQRAWTIERKTSWRDS